jgi:hypothetical protein
VQVPVSLSAIASGWRVQPAAGAGPLQLDLVENRGVVSGRATGVIVDGDTAITLDHQLSGSIDASQTVTGTIAVSVVYAGKDASTLCTQNVWTLTPR